MRHVETDRPPTEVRPLAVALNGLLSRVAAARRHEREVTAFAAHELRTPLAGLKTQAQVALAADDPKVVRGSLEQIVTAVDRSARAAADRN
ncbi:two-component system, OmpR family, sensor histidine kinase QseC [Bradyrhizobium sp. Gha]|nr:two-component system, OmpR family, sensor histidine kinase QseC [Bradyrhizobium sp. Gha]